MNQNTRIPKVLIGLTGPAGSGKDTVAQELTRHWTAAGHSWDVMAFADPIRAMCRAFLRHAGIDEPEDYLTDRQLKELVIPEVGASYRHLAQTLGTEWGQQCIGRNVWIRLLEQRLIASSRRGVTHIAITDARFPVEADWLRMMGGVIWRVDRPGVEPVRAHVSETEMRGIRANQVIRNDGTLEDLGKAVRYGLNVLDYERGGLVRTTA